MRKLSRLLAFILILVMLGTMSVSCKKGGDDELDGSIENAGTNESEGSGSDTSNDENKNDTDTNKPVGNGNTNTNDKNNAGNGNANTNTENKRPVTESTDGGGIVEDDRGSVLETNKNQTVDENFHINEAVTNDNGFIPDEEQGLEKSERRATEESKYDFDKNPLINRDRQNNKDIMPSFNLNDTGFVRAGTKIEDLKGKSLVFYSPDSYALFSYRDRKGATIDEFEWFKQLKSEIGLSIKMTRAGHMSTVENGLRDMNAGKQMDIVFSSHVTYPSSLCISRSITDKININSIGSSPGVCKRTMDILKWGNTYRCIAPIGLVDVLWYNATLTQELGLSDPHKIWEADKWDWDAYSKFMHSVPEKTQDGKNLIANVHWIGNTSYLWPSTTGTPHIYVDADADVPTLINNWDAASTLRAWEFVTTVHNETGFVGKGSGIEEAWAMYEGTTLMTGTLRTQVYRDTEYSKHVQINWVPYPMENCRTLAQMEQSLNDKYGVNGIKPAVTHDGSAQFCGFAALLPKKTIKENNVDFALKFMELWATRFTEAYFDNLNVFEYYNFNYKQRKQYFDFVTQRTTFGLAMNDWRGCDLTSVTQFFNCFKGDAAYNIKTEATKGSNIVAAFVVDSLKFGQ